QHQVRQRGKDPARLESGSQPIQRLLGPRRKHVGQGGGVVVLDSAVNVREARKVLVRTDQQSERAQPVVKIGAGIRRHGRVPRRKQFTLLRRRIRTPVSVVHGGLRPLEQGGVDGFVERLRTLELLDRQSVAVGER